jgi:ABC-type nitrate/sulfonate/bicarbonate transport system substrate-binding protein
MRRRGILNVNKNIPCMVKKKIIFAAVFVLAVFLYVVFIKNPISPPSLQTVTVRLGWVHQAQFAGFYVAQEKGFYKDEGLNVELLPLDQNSNQVQELEQGKVDFSVMEAHQALVGVGDGAKIKAIMAVYQVNPHVLAAREDSGIRGPEDFNGKVIGFAGGEGEGNALFRIFIKKFSDPKSVTYKNLSFNTVDNFINREADVIDLYRTDQPYLAKKSGVPLTLIPLDAYGLSTYGDVVMASNDFLESRKDIVRKFASATRKGWEYALSHGEEAAVITLPHTSGNYRDIEYERHIIEQSAPLIRGSQSDFGRMDFVPWSTLYESMRAAGAITRDFDVNEAYTNEFIE